MTDLRVNNHWAIKHWFWWKKLNPDAHKFYDVYFTMRARCNRKTHVSYCNYGARGIKCLWKTFEDFKNDMYESYKAHVKKYGRENTSIDRIDVYGNYCRENCKRSTRHEQRMNCRDTLSCHVGWRQYKSTDISILCWIGIDAAWDRIRAFNKGKISAEQLMCKGKMKKNTWAKQKRIMIDWLEYTSRKIADLCWISIGTASQRMNRYIEWIWWKENLLRQCNGSKPS